MDALLVISNLPNMQSAKSLARILIESRLAACVNILPACCSVYRWKETIEEENEIPILIKTTSACYEELQTLILNHHPYELPEIIAVSVKHGLPRYLAWVESETSFESNL